MHLYGLLCHVGEWNLHGKLDGVEELNDHVRNHLEARLPLPARHHVAPDVESVEQVRLPPVVGGDYEVRGDIVLPAMDGRQCCNEIFSSPSSVSPPQVLVPEMSHPRLHFILLLKMVQSGLGDVNTPRLPPGLHVVGEVDVVGPDVVLPLPQAENPTEDPAAVDADPHVEINIRRLHDRPELQCP